MTAMGGKLDLILANMKGPTVQVSDEEEAVEAWTKDIADAWSEVKSCGRRKHKSAKPLKQRSRRHKSSSSSDSSSMHLGNHKVTQRGLPEKSFSQKIKLGRLTTRVRG